MKKIISLFIILATFLLLASSCSLLPEEISLCKVSFYVDGQLYDTKTVTFGQTVKMPSNPRKVNETFVAWCTGESIAYQYDFGKKVTSDLELHAYFTIDAIAMTNMISTQTIKSIVTVENKCYETIGGSMVEGTSETSQGSGVVIDISGGYCYVLTNYHVVENPKGFPKQAFTVEDPWGNRYEAHIYVNASRQPVAIEDYDLALIYFEYGGTSKKGLEEITLATDPRVNDYVATLGTPGGLQNTLTYGYVMNYQKINVGNDDASLQRVKFDIILHNAPINHGSSGGALINTKGQLVGINFAGYSDGQYGCSIPISKVIEFLNIYVYN